MNKQSPRGHWTVLCVLWFIQSIVSGGLFRALALAFDKIEGTTFEYTIDNEQFDYEENKGGRNHSQAKSILQKVTITASYRAYLIMCTQNLNCWGC